MSYDAPLAGLKVVDLSQGIAGPYCAMLLAQYGATVIKVEPVGAGDWSRTSGKVHGDHTAISVSCNLGKRSIALDLKQEAGKAVLWRLLDGADVMLESFRPGVVQRLGFGYDDVSAKVPRILYVAISGFGQRGPMAERPGIDPVLQAFTGMSTENVGEDGIPHRVPVVPVDMGTGLYAFQALAMSLIGRKDEARGRYIDASLIQSAASLQVVRMSGMHLEGGKLEIVRTPGGVFRVADAWMALSIRDNTWAAFCGAIDRPDLVEHPDYSDNVRRCRNADALYAIVRPTLQAQPMAHWAERFGAARLLYERLNTYAEFAGEAQTQALGLISWLPQPGLPVPAPIPNIVGLTPFAPGTSKGHAPTLGEHSAAILAEHGYGAAEIAGLMQGAVAGPA